MQSRSLVPVVALAFVGVLVSCGENNITNINEGLDDTATWVANLNGANERPNPVTTPATGRAWFTDNGNTITFYIEFRDLVQPLSLAHIHRGAADAAGGITVDLAPAAVVGQRSGVWAGTINMTVADVSPSETGVQSPEDLRALLSSGGAYVNIHSNCGCTPQTGFPGGEIRGQVVAR